MTNSDNVIRAGLTKKYKDYDVLTDSLNYTMQLPVYIYPTIINKYINEYITNSEEF